MAGSEPTMRFPAEGEAVAKVALRRAVQLRPVNGASDDLDGLVRW